MLPRLSVLDVAPVGPGVPASQAFSWSTDVAQAAERLGFHRFWVAEHHAVADIGASAPAVLIAHLAARTTTLRLGSGGVMLPNHAPLIVAEQFCTLHALHPGRIDLGVGRAKGGEPAAVRALGRAPDGGAPERFADQLDELGTFLRSRFPSGHPYETVSPSPSTDPPPVYLLGSSEESARFAGQRSLRFAFAHHLAPQVTATALAAYRAAFQPSPELAAPYAIATVIVVCASTQDEAERAAVAAALIRVRRALASRRGTDATVDELLAREMTTDEMARVAEALTAPGILVGSPGAVREGMLALARASGADELMLCALEYEGPGRIRTLTSVACAWAG